LPECGWQKSPYLAWLVTDGKDIRIEAAHPSWWNKGDEPIMKITHWMSLPPIPNPSPD